MQGHASVVRASASSIRYPFSKTPRTTAVKPTGAPALPRPKKPDAERRKRWDAFYFSERERAELREAARSVDLSVSQYFLQLHRNQNPGYQRDNAQTISALALAERRLLALWQRIAEALEPVEALTIFGALLNIERAFHEQVLRRHKTRASHQSTRDKP